MHRRKEAPEHNILADITQFVRMKTWNRHLAGRVTEFTNHSAANLRLISLTALPAHNKYIFCIILTQVLLVLGRSEQEPQLPGYRCSVD